MAQTPVEFWQWLVDVGAIQGDPTFYSSGQAKPFEFLNAFQVADINLKGTGAYAEFFERLVDVGYIEGDPSFYSSGLAKPDEVTHAFDVATKAADSGVLTPPPSPAGAVPTDVTVDPSPAADPVAADALVPGILGGGSLLKVSRTDQEDLWFAQYEYPAGSGMFQLFQFDNLAQLTAAAGSDFATSGDFAIEIQDESFLQDENVNIVDEAAPVVGLEGNYQQLIEDTMFQAALDAGLRDPTRIGDFLADPDIQRTLALGALGQWTDTRVQAEIRNSSYYQDTLYPGITNLFGLSDNPERAYKQYEANVDEALDLLGVQRDADGSFKTTIGDLLGGGVDDGELINFAPVFVRAAQSPEYADVLNQWTERDLGESIDFDDVFDVLQGTERAELTQVVERANIQFQAEQQTLEISRRQIETLARTTQLTEAQLAANFSTTEQRLLSLGDEGLRRSGLTQAALISASFGQSFVTGQGQELSATEISQRASKFAIELGLADDSKLQVFVGFDPVTGTPFRPGLRQLAPETA